MKTYRHLFFDLDHTLWDFEKCSGETLQEIYLERGFESKYHFSFADFNHSFRKVNLGLWDKYNRHQVTRDEIRSTRFGLVFDLLNIQPIDDCVELGTLYLEACPKKSHVIDHALEVLEKLSHKYQLHILTNGFDDVQLTKLKSSGLEAFFDVIVTSENSNSRKPDKEIFEYAFKHTGAHSKESVMIGDNLQTDIAGAINVGMDSIFYNPSGEVHNYAVTFEVKSLAELKLIL